MAARVTGFIGRRAALATLVVAHTLAAARVAAAGDSSATARPASPKLAERAARAKAGPRVIRHVVISIPDCKLALIENDRVVRVYSVAVGAKTSPTPVGTFTIVNRITNPTYYHPGTVIPPGESNPLGTRWMGLNAKGFGIHGTDTPSSIGHPRSHGCIRMRNADLEELFERLRPGDLVELRGERTAELAQWFVG